MNRFNDLRSMSRVCFALFSGDSRQHTLHAYCISLNRARTSAPSIRSRREKPDHYYRKNHWIRDDTKCTFRINPAQWIGAATLIVCSGLKIGAVC